MSQVTSPSVLELKNPYFNHIDDPNQMESLQIAVDSAVQSALLGISDAKQEDAQLYAQKINTVIETKLDDMLNHPTILTEEERNSASVVVNTNEKIL